MIKKSSCVDQAYKNTDNIESSVLLLNLESNNYLDKLTLLFGEGLSEQDREEKSLLTSSNNFKNCINNLMS